MDPAAYIDITTLIAKSLSRARLIESLIKLGTLGVIVITTIVLGIFHLIDQTTLAALLGGISGYILGYSIKTPTISKDRAAGTNADSQEFITLYEELIRTKELLLEKEKQLLVARGPQLSA